MARNSNRLLDILDRLEQSPEFTAFHAQDPTAFLAHIFLMEDPANKDQVQIGYYDAAKERMTTFVVNNDSIQVLSELEVFKKPDAEILPLDRNAVSFDDQHILAKADQTQQEKYPGHHITKRLFILQHLSIGQVFNVTYITQAFKTINMKFDSRTGELKKHHLDSLISVIS